jgi:hypothetical protein
MHFDETLPVSTGQGLMFWGIVVGIIAAVALRWGFKAGYRKLFGEQKMAKSWIFWLIFLGLSTAVTLGASSLISVFFITIIGIPIALYLLAAPFLFLVVAGTYLISRFLGASWSANFVGLMATLALLAIPPFLGNRELDNNARSLIAQDRDDGTKPAARVIAVRSDKYWGKNKDTLNCDGFCQRALINGVAERVLVVEQDLNLAVVPETEADSFRFERRVSCPQVKLLQGHDPIEIKEERKGWTGKRSDELMQIEIAKGNCLIAEKAPLGTADIVLTVGSVRRGANRTGSRFSIFADTIKADRIALHEKKGDGFAETYRKTFVVMHKLMPLYAPTAEGGSELRMYPALARTRETINITEKYYEKPDWTAFLIGRLGMDLALRADNADADARTVLQDALLRTGEGQTVPAAVGNDFFERIQRTNEMLDEDYAIARQMFEDDRFPVPYTAASAIREAKNAPAGYFDAIGVAMFKRLRTFAASDDGKRYPAWRDEAASIGNVINVLPAETIKKHYADLDWLARQDRPREYAYTALSRFNAFGQQGAKSLLWLIDDAQRFAKERDNDWQHPYLAGLTGLCKMGPEAKELIQPIYDRLDSGVIANWGSYSRLAIHTLVRMGAEPEDIWRRVQLKGKDAAKDPVRERNDFDRMVRQAQKREECWF